MNPYILAALTITSLCSVAGWRNAPARFTAAILRVLLPAHGQHAGDGSQDEPVLQASVASCPPWGEVQRPDATPAEDDDSISPAEFTQFDMPPGRVRPFAHPDQPDQDVGQQYGPG